MAGGFQPKNPSGGSSEARFMQWVHEFVARRLRFINSPTVRWDVTSQGVIAHAAPARGGGTSVISYEGNYDSTRAYSAGMIVRKVTGTSQGLYICNTAAPAGQQPIYPEPTSGTVYWHLWTLAPQQYTECSEDPNAPTRSIWVHASGQF